MKSDYWFARILMIAGIILLFATKDNALVAGLGITLFGIGCNIMCELDLSL